jgi:plasmid stabilization system protein ParE
MNYQVSIQPEAFQEIEDAYRWLCDNLSPDLANRWFNDLQTAIESLSTFPRRCSLAPEANAVGREVRQLIVGKKKQYRVLFVVQENNVSILHVRHSRQSRSMGETVE